jgi:hypothetical protein
MVVISTSSHSAATDLRIMHYPPISEGCVSVVEIQHGHQTKTHACAQRKIHKTTHVSSGTEFYDCSSNSSRKNITMQQGAVPQCRIGMIDVIQFAILCA